jgi:di/tricarboxylate transporter
VILTFVILAVTIILFVSDKIRVDIVAMLALLALTLTGLIDTNQALAGFANSTVVTIAGLFVVGGGLFRTGVADWLGDQLLRLAGDSETRLLIVLMLGAAVLSAFLSNTGTVAVLLPAVVAAAWRIGSTPSKLLIPMAFAAQTGGLLTLIGTPPNIVIADALAATGTASFGFFEFALIGVPLLVVGILYTVFLGRRWLPQRHTAEGRVGLPASPEELAEAYHLDNCIFRLRVRRGSTLVGKTLAEAALGRDYGVSVVRIERGEIEKMESAPQRALESLTDTLGMHQSDIDELTPGPETTIHVDDVLLVEGTHDSTHRLALDFNLGIRPIQATDDHPEAELLSREIGLAEILITPRSSLIGRTIADVNFGEKYSVRVLRIFRRGSPIEDVSLMKIKLAFGDALLVRGTWEAIGIMENEARNFVVVGRPAALVRPSLSPRSIIALLALLGMLLMMVTGVVSTVIAVLITAMVMLLSGCLNTQQAYRSISWESIILLAAMLPMSTALEVTGGAEFIANGLVNTLGAFHPILLIVGIFVLTTGFTQVISNTATTVLLAPIVLQAATELRVAPQPIMMMVAVAASTAFLTPIASPVNTLVLTPGGYRFSDFMQTGLPLLILFLLTSVILIPLIWTF